MFGGKRRGTKYSSVKVEVDGIKFASKKEARRYAELKLLVSAGAIRDLQLQVTYRCEVNGVKVCDYRADFVYVRVRDGAEVVEDVKGFRTDVYKLKKRLMAACNGIEIKEV
ncbi:MAG TPA: DUF1064 domain-containing protein [Gemmata sp.]